MTSRQKLGERVAGVGHLAGREPVEQGAGVDRGEVVGAAQLRRTFGGVIGIARPPLRPVPLM
jgi:hypothetical protein